MAYGVDKYPDPPEREDREECEYDENLSPRFDDLADADQSYFYRGQPEEAEGE